MNQSVNHLWLQTSQLESLLEESQQVELRTELETKLEEALAQITQLQDQVTQMEQQQQQLSTDSKCVLWSLAIQCTLVIMMSDISKYSLLRCFFNIPGTINFIRFKNIWYVDVLVI